MAERWGACGHRKWEDVTGGKCLVNEFIKSLLTDSKNVIDYCTKNPLPLTKQFFMFLFRVQRSSQINVALTAFAFITKKHFIALTRCTYSWTYLYIYVHRWYWARFFLFVFCGYNNKPKAAGFTGTNHDLGSSQFRRLKIHHWIATSIVCLLRNSLAVSQLGGEMKREEERLPCGNSQEHELGLLITIHS